MNNTIEFPHRNRTPKGILQETINQFGDRLEEVIVIGRMKDGGSVICSNSIEVPFLATTHLILQDLATKAVSGHLVKEEE